MIRDYKIKISVSLADTDENVCVGESLSFESASEELGKLARFVENEESNMDYTEADAGEGPKE